MTIKNIYAIEYNNECIGTIDIIEFAWFDDKGMTSKVVRRKDLDKQEGATVYQYILQALSYEVYIFIRTNYKLRTCKD